MADFSILVEVIPELAKSSELQLAAVWREWTNDQPDVIRRWLTRPLSANERRVLQCQFASEWYRRESLAAQDRVAEDARKAEINAQLAAEPANHRYERLEVLPVAQDPFVDAGER